MRKIVCFSFFMLSAYFAFSEEGKVPCWVSGDSSKVITSQEAILKTYLLPIDLSDPQGDAKKRITHGDYRLVGIGGVGLKYPALDKSDENRNILCKFGGRYIRGTRDAHESENHTQLMSRFTAYAKAYNEVIIGYYNPHSRTLTN
jgi:hypothetical protein